MPPTDIAAQTKAASPARSQRSALRVAAEGAQHVLQRRFRVLLLIRDAYAHLIRHGRALDAVREDLGALLRLLKAWTLGRYRAVPWTPLLLIACAVIYFVMPVDLIPDALAGLGFMDDMAIISTTVRAVRGELDRFRQWEAAPLPPASS